MTGLKNLWELQILEEKKAGLEKQMKTIPEFKELKLLKAEIEGGQEEVRQIRDELLDNRKSLKEVEKTVAGLKAKIKKASDELYSGEINNTKELEAAQKNIATVREKVEKEEESALRLMETLEGYEARLERIISDLEDKKNDFRKLNRYYNDKKVELANILMELEARKEALLKGIEPAQLESYYQVSQRMPDRKGVALLQNGTCSGCHMRVSFDLMKQAKSRNDLTCDNCGRFLIPE